MESWRIQTSSVELSFPSCFRISSTLYRWLRNLLTRSVKVKLGFIGFPSYAPGQALSSFGIFNVIFSLSRWSRWLLYAAVTRYRWSRIFSIVKSDTVLGFSVWYSVKFNLSSNLGSWIGLFVVVFSSSSFFNGGTVWKTALLTNLFSISLVLSYSSNVKNVLAL